MFRFLHVLLLLLLAGNSYATMYCAVQNGFCYPGASYNLRSSITGAASASCANVNQSVSTFNQQNQVVYCSRGFSSAIYEVPDPPNCSGAESYIGTNCNCPSGSTLQNGVCTVAQVQDCPKGQYKTGGACIAVPDCNANSVTGGNYFDVSSGQCLQSQDLLICIGRDANGAGGEYSISCPVLQECIKPGELCTNNAADVQSVQDAKAGIVQAAKAKAAQAATDAAAAKTQADTAKTAKENASANSASQAAAAQAAAQAAAANGTTSSSAIQAAQAAATAAQRAATDAIAAANAAAQKVIADAQEAIASARNGTLQGQNSYGGGQSTDIASQGRSAADRAVSAGIGATGGTSPNGTTPGSEQGQMNCPDCAKETTLQSANNKLGEIKYAITAADNVYETEPLGTATFTQSNTRLINGLKDRITLPTIQVISVDCPVFVQHIPFLEVDLTIDQFCTMEPMIRPYIEAASMVMWSIMGLFLIMGA